MVRALRVGVVGEGGKKVLTARGAGERDRASEMDWHGEVPVGSTE